MNSNASYQFMMSKFGGVEKTVGKGRIVVCQCPNCDRGKPPRERHLAWFFDFPHTLKCMKGCDMNGKTALDLGFKPEPTSDRSRPEIDPFSMESFKYRRRRRWPKEGRHRLSDKVVAEFALKPRSGLTKSGKTDIRVPFLNQDGEPIKYLTTYAKSWMSVEAKFKPKDFWLNLHRIAGNKDPKRIFILAGEWDLFAFWERTGIHGISPAFGETSKPKADDTDIFQNKEVIMLFDNDSAGRKGGREMANTILKHQKGVTIKSLNLALLGCPAGEDIDWYFANGGTPKVLAEKIKETPLFTSGINEDIHKLISNLPERGIVLPDNPVSDLQPENLEVIWRAGALPENQKNRVFEQLAIEEGISAEKPRQIANRVRYFDNELTTLIFKAFDDYLTKTFADAHIKAEGSSGLYERNYYYYHEGVYRSFSSEKRRRMVDHIARMLCSKDSRFNLSRYRKQLDEDLTNRLDNLPDHKFDTDTDIINFRNGLFNLKEELLQEHTPDYLSTFQLGIEYHQGSPCPWFLQALETWFEEEEIRREFLKVCYYAISGNRGQHIAAFFYGEGGDGKGEAVKILKALVGEDRTSAISLEDLEDQFMPAGLFGKWLNIADEINRKTHINDGKFKKVTGGSTFTSNVKYGQPITFESKALWVVIANSVFSSSDNSRGFNRRLKFVVFRQVPAEKKIENFFYNHLRHELSGIAEYILTEGKRLYETEGFRETQADVSIKDDLARGHSVNAYWQDVLYEMAEDMATRGTIDHDLTTPIRSGKYDGWHYIDPKAHFEKYKELCKETGMHASSYQNFSRDSRNVIEKLLNSEEISPGRGPEIVRVRPEKIRISETQFGPKKPARVIIVNQDPKKIMLVPGATAAQASATETRSIEQIWTETL